MSQVPDQTESERLLRSLSNRLNQELDPSWKGRDRKAVAVELGLSSPYKRAFPEKVLHDLITDHDTHRALPSSLYPGLAAYVCRNARKTFAITLVSLSSASDQIDALREFVTCAFSDESKLPIASSGDLPKEVLEAKNSHGSQLWDSRATRAFYENQWAFLIFKFDKRQFRFDRIDVNAILPLRTEGNANAGNGNFSQVRRARMLAQYQDTISTDEEWIEVAIKELQDPKDGSAFNIDKEWRREANAHKRLNDPGHKHLVTAIAASKFGSKHYLILEWANGSESANDLAQYMQKHTGPQISHRNLTNSRHRIRILLEQIRGLSSGLEYMHNNTQTIDSDYSSGVSAASSPTVRPSTPIYNINLSSLVLEETEEPSEINVEAATPGAQGPVFQITVADHSHETSPHPATVQSTSYAESSNVQTGAETSLSLRAKEPSAFVHGGRIAPTGYPPMETNAKFTMTRRYKDAAEPSPGHLTTLKRVGTGIGPNASKHHRHGDVKLDNVLRCRLSTSNSHGDDWIGLLKLADLGRAQEQDAATQLRPETERELYRAKRYEPPDLYLPRESGISRLFDIWSLGCVILELIQWMLYGDDFRQNWIMASELAGSQASKSNNLCSPYFVMIGTGPLRTARVTDRASTLMDHIINKDPEGNRALGDLAKLVKKKMLVVPLPPDSSRYSPNCRTNAIDLVRELDLIIAKADRTEDYDYLFSGTDRTTVPAPNLNPEIPKLRKLSSGNLAVPEHLLSARGEPMGNATLIIREGDYTNDVDDAWRYCGDPDFASVLFDRKEYQGHRTAMNELQQEPYLQICPKCRQALLSSKPFEVKLEYIGEMEGECEFCSMLQTYVEEYLENCTSECASQLKDEGVLKLGREEVGLKRHDRDALAFKFCSISLGDGPSETYPLGAAFLPSFEHKGRFEFLRHCLKECDRAHEGCQEPRLHSQPRALPKRLLEVSPEGLKNKVRVIETTLLSDAQKDDLKYAALSHQWGSIPFRKSTTDNIKEHLSGILTRRLPQSFQDAAKVTEALGLTYLWIDSLCIVQEGEKADFDEEAPKMEDIYSSAYCVLAASSASGASEGFLKRPSGTEQCPVKRVDLEHEGRREFLVAPAIDDFQRDVLESTLETRGWVLQEHALARRTLFFTNNQTYFECGDGIRCETLTKLSNSQAAFLGHPRFPGAAVERRSTRGTQIYHFEQLFQKYSARNFSRQQDRPVAIDGLMRRMTKAFKTKTEAGVFQSFWGRCLLWRKSDPKIKLKRIDFTNHKAGERTHRSAPTWSWMAYQGAIMFIKVEPKELNWNGQVKISGMFDNTESWVARKNWDTPVAITIDVHHFEITAVADRDQSDLWYDKDLASRPVRGQGFVVGTQKKPEDDLSLKCFVIIVQKITTPGEQGYERIGAGSLPRHCIDDRALVRGAIIV